jgi:hypothetical protein
VLRLRGRVRRLREMGRARGMRDVYFDSLREGAFFGIA